MSRVVVTELQREATATVANANATVTSWNTASADVDETNVREMGLDRRSMGTRSFTPTDGRPSPLVRSGAAWAEVPDAGPTQVSDGATLIEIGPIAFDILNGDQLEVGCSFSYEILGGLAASQATFSLGYGTASGGPWTEITVTARRTQLSAGLVAQAGCVDNGSCTISHKFQSTSSATLYLALLYRLTGVNNITFENLTFGATLYAR